MLIQTIIRRNQGVINLKYDTLAIKFKIFMSFPAAWWIFWQDVGLGVYISAEETA